MNDAFRSTGLALLTRAIMQRFPRVGWIGAEQWLSWPETTGGSAPLVLDVRSHAEYCVSHLRGARWRDPEASLRTPLGPALEAPVLVYCSIGYRSARLAEQLQAQGHVRVFNLEGGIFGWANAGRSVVRNDAPVRRVHPFGPPWSWLLAPELHATEPAAGGPADPQRERGS
jgi:rhodanese-related sulfurtransferase